MSPLHGNGEKGVRIKNAVKPNGTWNHKGNENIYLNKVVRTTHKLRRVGLRYENIVIFPRFLLDGGLNLIFIQIKLKQVLIMEWFLFMCELWGKTKLTQTLTICTHGLAFLLNLFISGPSLGTPSTHLRWHFCSVGNFWFCKRAKTTPPLGCAFEKYMRCLGVTWRPVLEGTITIKGVCFTYVRN